MNASAISYAGVPSITMGSTHITTTSASTLNYLMYQADGTGQALMIPEHDQVGYNIEDAYGKDDEFHEALVCVRCPHCAYPNYPFRKKKKKPKCLETGEEWVGIDYKQPYAHYECWCSYCDEAYYLRLFAPQ